MELTLHTTVPIKQPKAPGIYPRLNQAGIEALSATKRAEKGSTLTREPKTSRVVRNNDQEEFTCSDLFSIVSLKQFIYEPVSKNVPKMETKLPLSGRSKLSMH